MIIWQDKNNKITYESGDICGYVRNIFGSGWVLARVIENITPEQARQFKKLMEEWKK